MTEYIPVSDAWKKYLRRFGISERFVRERCDDGTIRAIRVGSRAIRVNVESVKEYARRIEGEENLPG